MLRLYGCMKGGQADRCSGNAVVGPRLLETGCRRLTEAWRFVLSMFLLLYVFVVKPNHTTSGLSMEGIVSRICFKMLQVFALHALL